jgi:predicted O-linked N-acetylglucosamine transferase (SPINDLY family)
VKAVGLEELVTTSRDAYEDLAVALASDPLRLRNIRTRLGETGPRSALFDTDRFTRHLESALIAMQQRYDAGLAPEHIRF